MSHEEFSLQRKYLTRIDEATPERVGIMRNHHVFGKNKRLLLHTRKIAKSPREKYLNRVRSSAAVTLRDTNLTYNNGPYQANCP